MAIVLTVVADGPAALAELWGHLGGNKAELDIVGDEMFIAVDLTTPEPEAGEGADLEAGEAADHEAADGHVRSAGCTSPASNPEPEHDGDTVDVGEVQVVEPEQDADEPPTLRDRVLATINSHPDRTFTLAQVYEHLEGENQGSVSASVQWLVSHNRIRRVARGQYQAIDRSAVHDARRQAAAAAMYSS